MTSDRAAAAVARALAQPAWALVRRGEEDTVLVAGGPASTLTSLADVRLRGGVPEPGRIADTLLAVPFRQVRERGFVAHDDGAPLVAVDLEVAELVPLVELMEVLPDESLSGSGDFETDDDEYAGTVRRIIRDEIGNGQGANLVVGRRFRGRMDGWGPDAALTVFRHLLERERGAYWTQVFWTGERYLIGASPERHVSVRGGDVRMNPISGTLRLGELAGLGAAERKARLLDFLADEKEIFELFMVVDEELKMICDVCQEGGLVLGPYLKPMSQLVHTEYLLAGRTRADPRQVLRDTMFAATVTGAPVENACRLIRAYEAGGRGYYGAALALLGRDASGAPTADSPIVIRTAEVTPDGGLSVTAGATLVRDSDPHAEVAETRAKAAGILSAFGLAPPAGSVATDIGPLTQDEDVLIALGSRNQRLAGFWLTDQSDAVPAASLLGRRVAILHGEDDFVNMLARVFGVLGLETSVVRHEDYRPGALAGHDLVVVGPGPGDPRDGEQPKVATFRAAVTDLLAGRTPFLAVCLGHQVLCDRLGLSLVYKDVVFQGTQSPVTIAGRTEKVGFYNTFVARVAGPLPPGVTVETDACGDVHLVSGPHFRGLQFHPESILTEHGFAILRGLLLELLG